MLLIPDSEYQFGTENENPTATNQSKKKNIEILNVV